MNPEFERNVWLELTPLRMIVMVAVLALAFFAAAVTAGNVAGPGTVARWAFDFIVVFWGARNAARSVVGEIRDRTWDGQRLSSLGAGTMMWGKLFGSTIFNWFGGAICLVVIAADAFDTVGVAGAVIRVAYFIALGVTSQAVSLLASLIAARRRQGRSQFEVFLYQMAGIIAGFAVWDIADPTYGFVVRSDNIVWWGQALPSNGFLLASLVVFTAWILMGCYRQMRLELKVQNGPFVWLAFVAFLATYVAGFDAWVPKLSVLSDPVAVRLMLAGITCATLAYIIVFLEPKDRVSLRWFGAQLAQFRIGSAFMKLQGWMVAWFAAMLIGIALLAYAHSNGQLLLLAGVAAVMGFVTRDMAIVLLMNMAARRRGGDLLSIAVLVLLYWLLPSILSGLHYSLGQAIFLPRATDPLWLSPAAAWIEAVVVWAFAITKIALPEERAA
jgi:hypothetical protein